MLTLHGSCVALAGSAVLLRGPSGAGKSDLALRLLDAGAQLVADDQTILRRHARPGQKPFLLASAPETIAGLIEIRGIGPVDIRSMGLAPAPPTPLRLIVDLAGGSDVPRLPESRYEALLSVPLPCLTLDAFAASAPVKLKWALARAAAGRLFAPDEALAMRPHLVAHCA
ncbi:MAG TPA: HPr kinase/phosphatase C-terminal domain-containing protein [Ferrovibrio sp.]|uniref:HPr kinase/phosphorylase n=1 Tax=Ferrovibrio sp. TaxID=1917215 RepID=UPI002ED3C04F